MSQETDEREREDREANSITLIALPVQLPLQLPWQKQQQQEELLPPDLEYHQPERRQLCLCF